MKFLNMFAAPTNGSGSPKSNNSETSGSASPTEEVTNKQLAARLVRLESRLVQLMIHMGVNPYGKQYDITRETAGQHLPGRR